MPLATIEIEQVAANHWIARLETGSMTARRAIYHGATLAGVMADAEAGYWELSGAQRPAETVCASPVPKRGRPPMNRERNA